MQNTYSRWLTLAFVAVITVFAFAGNSFVTNTTLVLGRQLGIKAPELGLVLTMAAMYSLPFAVPLGFLADRLGARSVLAAILALSAVLVGAEGMVSGVVSLLAVNGLSGALSIGVWPCVFAAVAAFFPAREHGRIAGALLLSGAIGRAGAAGASRAFGSSSTYYILFIGGLFLAVGWYLLPRLLPRGAPEPVFLAEPSPLREVFPSTEVWLLVFAYLALSLGRSTMYSMLDLMELKEGLLPLATSQYHALLGLAGGVIAFFAGNGSDFLAVKIGVKWARRSIAVAGMVLPAVLIQVSTRAIPPSVTRVYVVYAGLALCSLATVMIFAACLDVAKRYPGTAVGLVVGVVALGDLYAHSLIGSFLQHSESIAAVLTSVALLIGAGAWFAIDAGRSAVS